MVLLTNINSRFIYYITKATALDEGRRNERRGKIERNEKREEERKEGRQE